MKGKTDLQKVADAEKAVSAGLSPEAREVLGVLGSSLMHTMARPSGKGLAESFAIEASTDGAALLIRRALHDGRAVRLAIEQVKGEGLVTVLDKASEP